MTEEKLKRLLEVKEEMSNLSDMITSIDKLINRESKKFIDIKDSHSSISFYNLRVTNYILEQARRELQDKYNILHNEWQNG